MLIQTDLTSLSKSSQAIAVPKTEIEKGPKVMMSSSIGAQTIIRNGAWTSQEEYDCSQQSPIKKEHQDINLSPKGGIIDSLEKS